MRGVIISSVICWDILEECLIYSTQWIPLVLGFPWGVTWWVTTSSDFLSICLFRPFCDAFSSRLLMYAVNSRLSSGICGGALAVSWGVNIVRCWIVDSSGNLLVVACTEALCMSRVEGDRRISSLVPWDLDRSMKISTQKIQFTIPWPVGVSCLEMQICCCTAWKKEYIIQLHQSRLLLNSREKGQITHWITTNKLTVCRVKIWNWTLW